MISDESSLLLPLGGGEIAANWRGRVVEAAVATRPRRAHVTGNLVAINSAPPMGAGRLGPAYVADGTGLWRANFPASQIATSVGTALVIRGVFPTSAGWFASLGENTSTGGYFGLGYDAGNARHVAQFRDRVGNNITEWRMNSGGVKSGTVVVYIASVTDIKIFLNGEDATGPGVQSGGGNSPNWSRFNVLGLLRDVPAGYAPVGASVNAFFALRNISLAEAQEISADLSLLFEPDDDELVFADAPAGTTTSAGIGSATAAGAQAAVSTPVSISCGAGAATAAGSTARVDRALAVGASVGAAAAAGQAARIDAATATSCGVGAAAAAGLTARVDAASTASCGVGTAAATGLTARVDAATPVAATTGAASASGLAAAITASGATTIACAVGTAQATGSSARVDLARWLAAQVAAAQADGAAATIATARVVSAAVAAASANGLNALVIQGQFIAAQVAAAQALGLPATVVGSGTAAPDILSYVMLELQAGLAAEFEASPIEVEIQNV